MPRVESKNSLNMPLLRGTYPRLYLAILTIMVVVSLLRYHLLIRDAVSEAATKQQQQVEMMGRYLPEALLRNSLNATQAEINTQLESILRDETGMQSIAWAFYGKTHSAEDLHGAAVDVPAWFASFATLPRLNRDFAIAAPDGSVAKLTIVMRSDQDLMHAWHTVSRQIPVSILIVVTVFVLLTFLLHINTRLLFRLDRATNALRSGALNVRMRESGTVEMRAVAKTFNAMAAEIQSLVVSLERSRSEQGEQLHFTHQLINSLPLPVFVRGQDGVCLGVNTAWEAFFSQNPGAALGELLSSDFAGLAHRQSLNRGLEVPKEDCEIQIQVHANQVRDIAYFKVPYTSKDGKQAGTIGALVDITDRKSAQLALQAEKDRALVTLSSIADAVITTNSAGCIETMNEAAQYLTGHMLDQAKGQPLTAVFRRDIASRALPQSLELSQLHLVSSPVHALNQLLLHRSGERYAIEFTASPIREIDGSIAGCVLVFRDVTETQELQKQISWQARHDSLTGLNNRTALAERMTHALFQTREAKQSLAVCLLDLDNFQQVNEVYGQWVGDRLLKEVGLRMLSFVKEASDVARLGGDEFVVLLTCNGNSSQLGEQVHGLLARLSQP